MYTIKKGGWKGKVFNGAAAKTRKQTDSESERTQRYNIRSFNNEIKENVKRQYKKKKDINNAIDNYEIVFEEEVVEPVKNTRKKKSREPSVQDVVEKRVTRKRKPEEPEEPKEPKKMKEPKEKDVDYKPYTVSGINIVSFIELKKSTKMNKTIVDEILEPIGPGKTLYQSLSQLLSGSEDMVDILKHDLDDYIKVKNIDRKREDSEKKGKENIIENKGVANILYAVSKMYKCNVLFFVSNDFNYNIYPFKQKGNTKTIYLRQEVDDYIALNIVKKERKDSRRATNGDIIKSGEYEIDKIIGHVLKHNHKKDIISHDLRYAKYTVKWLGYEDNSNTSQSWDSIKYTEKLDNYIKELEPKDEYTKKAIEALEKIDKLEQVEIENYGTHDGKKSKYRRKNYSRRIGKKNFTGQRMSVMEMIDLKGKGGCYCFMPYESLDARKNAIFKIGMTLDFDKRADQYHTYFPNGVYNVAFLSE